MFRAELSEKDLDGTFRLTFEASGFLRHMVRNLVGTIIDAGKGKIQKSDLKRSWMRMTGKGQGQWPRPRGCF
jgi:tRNA pseudouridine38-40 synthase